MMQQQPLIMVSVGQPAGHPGFFSVPPGQQVAFIRPQAKRVSPTYKDRQSVYLGVALVVSGALSVIFNIVDLGVSSDVHFGGLGYYGNSLSFTGHGLWSGVLCILTGGFCIGAGKTKSICQVRTVIVLGIIAACCCGAQLGVAITGATIVGSNLDLDSMCSVSLLLADFCRKLHVLLAMEILLAICGLVGGIAAIWSSALGCQGACCCNGCCCTDVDYQQFGEVVQGYSSPTTVFPQQQQLGGREAQQFMGYSVTAATVQHQQGNPQGVQFTATPPYTTTAAAPQAMASDPSPPQVNDMAPQQLPVNIKYEY